MTVIQFMIKIVIIGIVVTTTTYCYDARHYFCTSHCYSYRRDRPGACSSHTQVIVVYTECYLYHIHTHLYICTHICMYTDMYMYMYMYMYM